MRQDQPAVGTVAARVVRSPIEEGCHQKSGQVQSVLPTLFITYASYASRLPILECRPFLTMYIQALFWHRKWSPCFRQSIDLRGMPDCSGPKFYFMNGVHDERYTLYNLSASGYPSSPFDDCNPGRAPPKNLGYTMSRPPTKNNTQWPKGEQHRALL